MIELTDEMVTAAAEVIEEECVRRRGHDLGTIHRDDIVRAGLAAVLALVERRLRAAIAEDIRQALAADEADSDVTSCEAIWEQSGYRRGLAAAAEIVRGAP
jgi:hypothetical protein